VVGSLIGINQKFGGGELFYPILVFIPVAGLLMSARLALNAHSPTQILAGCLLGLSISLGTVYWFF
jgi:membrane-associated phospholipid phosphatase